MLRSTATARLGYSLYMGRREIFGAEQTRAGGMGPHFARLVCVGLLILCYSGMLAADNASFRWKSVDGAQVKLNEKVPLAWNVYQLDKKKQPNLVLILLGRRYILLDSKAKLAYQVMPSQLHADGQDFTSGDLAQKEQLIPSAAWTMRDIGPAEEIHLNLRDYDTLLSVQLPHPLNIRLGVY